MIAMVLLQTRSVVELDLVKAPLVSSVWWNFLGE